MTLQLTIVVPAFNEAHRLGAGMRRFEAAVSAGAIDLDHPQHAAHLVQALGAGLERRRVVGALGTCLKRGARGVERRAQLRRDNLQCLLGNRRH